MTPEQKSQFYRFGCFPRCLIELARRNQQPISVEDFCARFAKSFYDPKTQYGLLKPDHIPLIAQSLSLPSAAGPEVLPAKVVPLPDYDQFAKLHEGGTFILVASKVNLNEGATDPLGHCSVLDEIGEQAFALWTPSQDGNDYVLTFSKKDWAEKECAGMVLV